jgi:hypothetical protein
MNIYSSSIPLHNLLHLLPVYQQIHLSPQHNGNPAVPISWISLDLLINRMLNALVYGWSASPRSLHLLLILGLYLFGVVLQTLSTKLKS